MSEYSIEGINPKAGKEPVCESQSPGWYCPKPPVGRVNGSPMCSWHMSKSGYLSTVNGTPCKVTEL